MGSVLFNIHDVVLVVVVFEGLMLAALLALIKRGKRISSLLLAGFLLMNALIAYEILIYWCAPLNRKVAAVSTNLFFLFGFAYFLQGPLLLWYSRSLMYRDFHFKRIDSLHLLPSLIYPLFMYFAYYRFDDEYKMSLIISFWRFYVTPHFGVLVWLQKIAPVIYAILCLHQLVRYKARLEENYSNIEKLDLSWLKLLVGIFMATWIWAMLTQILAQFIPPEISSPMGIMNNYFILIMVNTLVVYGLANSGIFEGIMQNGSIADGDNDENGPLNHAELLKTVMERDKPYLEPDLTLEQLAERLGITPRTLSGIINREFRQNFFEFVNQYRVEQAKRLLLDPKHCEQTIIELMIMAGFNSKSAANRFFKKFTGMTASTYRQRHMAN